MTSSHPLSFPRHRSFPAIAVIVGFFQPIPGAADPALGQDAEHKTYFVRHTVGKDHYDGLTPETAWLTVNRGARELGAGDTLIIKFIQNRGLGFFPRPPITGPNGFEISLALVLTHITVPKFWLPAI